MGTREQMASWDHRWANPQLIESCPLKGFRAGCPKRCHSGVQIVPSRKQVRPKRLRKNPWTSPDWLKEFKMEGVFQGVITADNCSKEMATHSIMLSWKIPWTEEPGRLQSMGSWKVGNNWATHFHFSPSCIGEGNGSPLQCSCLENPRDGGAWWAGVYGVAQSWTRLKQQQVQ